DISTFITRWPLARFASPADWLDRVHLYDPVRPQYFNNGLAPTQYETTLTSCPGSVDH
ncbi:hypothetical protein GIV98_25250, partial [Pseudomonas syringae]|nr:hypothetical protein [Pseudomonas syringae]